MIIEPRIYWLTNVHIEYEKDSGYAEHTSEIRLPFKGNQALALILNNPREDATDAVLDTNSLRLKSIAHSQQNQMGGEKSIVLNVPIQGIDKGELEMHIYMSAPSGKSLSWYITPNDEEVTHSKGAYRIELPLNTHHEKGTYILDEISYVEGYSLSEFQSNQIVFRSHNHQEKIRFKERGIRKMITIDSPGTENEQF